MIKTQKCSICWYPRENLIYKNPKCTHSYCGQCVSKKHIPDSNIMRCFIPSCMGNITVDHMEDYFFQEQVNIADVQPKLLQSDQIPLVVNEKLELKECVVCMTNYSNHVAIPCGHVQICEPCLKVLNNKTKCFICNTMTQGFYKLYS